MHSDRFSIEALPPTFGDIKTETTTTINDFTPADSSKSLVDILHDEKEIRTPTSEITHSPVTPLRRREPFGHLIVCNVQPSPHPNDHQKKKQLKLLYNVYSTPYIQYTFHIHLKE
jgi:hypothetical protein